MKQFLNLYLILACCILTGCSNLFYQPSKDYFYEPASFKLSYEDIFFKSKDGTKLHGWFFPTQGKAKGTIIHFHGNAQNITTHFMNLAWIIKEGYNLFIFDYRGYGKSEGKPSQEGIYQDALAALEQGRILSKGEGLLVAYGQSLGGIIALRALVDYPHLDDIDLIVQDSTFSSYKDIAFDKLKSSWLLVPFSPLAFVLVSDKYASDEVFKKVTRPTLVVVGKKDTVVPAKFGKIIFKEIPAQKKWLWILPEGHHIEIFHNQNQSYRNEFIKLLDGLRRI